MRGFWRGGAATVALAGVGLLALGSSASAAPAGGPSTVCTGTDSGGVRFNVTGFRPFHSLQAAVFGASGRLDTTDVYTDAAGNGEGSFSGLTVGSSPRTFVVTVADDDGGTEKVTFKMTVTGFGARASRVGYVRKRTTLRYRFTGWKPGRAVYAQYYLRTGEQTALKRFFLKSSKVGVPRGPCGALAVRRRVLPRSLRLRKRTDDLEVYYCQTRRPTGDQGSCFLQDVQASKKSPVLLASLLKPVMGPPRDGSQ